MGKFVCYEGDLLACPFCGSEGEIRSATAFFPNMPTFYYPTCSMDDCIAYVAEQDECGGVNCEFDNPDEAASAWNTRSKP